MRSRAPLALMELAVMLLVLALAAALCLQVFAWADTRSRENAIADAALVELQSAAEVIKYCRGDLEAAAGLHGGTWDAETWEIPCEGFVIHAELIAGETALLGAASLEAVCREEVLAALTVYWQEVAHEG